MNALCTLSHLWDRIPPTHPVQWFSNLLSTDTQRYALKTRILKPHTLEFTIYILNHLPVDPGAVVFCPLLEKHPIKAIYKMLSFKGLSEISVPYFPLKGNFWRGTKLLELVGTKQRREVRQIYGFLKIFILS